MSHHYETAMMSGRKAIVAASAHKTHPTGGVIVTNAKAHAKLRKHELGIRVEQLERNIRLHKDDIDPDRNLLHLMIGWRKELMELKLERSTLGLG